MSFLNPKQNPQRGSRGMGYVSYPQTGPHGRQANVIYSQPGASTKGFPIIKNWQDYPVNYGPPGSTSGNPTGAPAAASSGERTGNRTRASGNDPGAASLSGMTFGRQRAGGTPLGARGAGLPEDYGTESGPGILQQWFKQRAEGTDPGYEYAMGRGMDSIDSRMAAGGSYNSGARGMQLSDFAANMGAQRQAQLDALAAGASGERAGERRDMMNWGMGLAGGQSGLMSVYDTKAADSLNTANEAILSMYLNKAGVDQKSRDAAWDKGLSAAALWGGG